MFAAGPFANIISALLFFGMLALFFNPISDQFYAPHVVITDMLGENSPAELAGLTPGESIHEINGVPITSTQAFSEAIRDRSPGDTVSVVTGTSVYDVTLGHHRFNL